MDRRRLLAAAGVPLLAALPLGGLRQNRRARSRLQSSPDAGPRVSTCFDVRSFGARGDGVTFDDAALVAAVAAASAAGGGVVFLPPGTYRVANGKEVALRDCANLVLFGPRAVLRNDTDTGNDGGIITFRGSTRNVSIIGLGFEGATASPNSYDNVLSFYSRPPDGIRNILVRGCRFGRASNKHLNFDGPASDVVIESSAFEGSHFNSNPLDVHSRFASIYFEFNQRAEFEVANVTIRRNHFADNSLFCVSLDEFAFPGDRALFHGIRITDNTFRDSTGGVWARGGDVWVQNNFFLAVGMSQMARRYRYQTTLGRYLSQVRSDAGQVAERANTVPLQRAAVVVVDGSRQAWVEGNVFVGCAPQQLGGPEQTAGGVYVSADGALGVRVTGNRAFERAVPAGAVPGFQCVTSPGSSCVGNDILVGQSPPAAPPQPAWPDSLAVAGYSCG